MELWQRASRDPSMPCYYGRHKGFPSAVQVLLQTKISSFLKRSGAPNLYHHIEKRQGATRVLLSSSSCVCEHHDDLRPSALCFLLPSGGSLGRKVGAAECGRGVLY